TTFTGFFDLSLSLGRVAFLAETLRVIADPSFPEGLLSAGAFRSAAGAFQTVADEGAAAPPGSGSFAFGAPPACCVSLDGDRVAFSPAGPAGIYGQTEGLPVDAVADSSTVIDGTSFSVLDRPAIHRGAVVFTATGAVRQGVFLAAGGAFSTVADTATTVPGRAGDPTFGFFGQPSIHQGQVAFKGCTADVKCGVYTTLGGGLNKVVALGDVLDGQTVDDVEVSREAISCSSVAFLARFSGGGQAVYRADLAGGAPCPGGLDSLGALTVWGGLKSSDDQGTAFDVRAEVRVDGVLVAEGEARCVTGLTRNPSRARPVEVTFPALSPGGTAGDGELSLTVLARVGTDGAGGRCSGPGATHASAVGLRVYFDSLSRPSRFGVGVNGGSAQTLYLHGSGPACSSRPGPPGTALSLDGVAPTPLVAQCADSRAVDFKGGNPWREVGTWTASLAGAAGATAAPTAPSGWRERLRAWRAR
ncbi:MAG TPA: hypothetical protein VGB87_25115, partial [Vicinamibacteria bacterium]